jgi:methyl-accepting chemotaxis protein
MSRQIALALEEQSKGVKQVVNSTTDVARLMKNNLSHSTSIVQSSIRLMSQADDLLESVRSFQLDTASVEGSQTDEGKPA